MKKIVLLYLILIFCLYGCKKEEQDMIPNNNYSSITINSDKNIYNVTFLGVVERDEPIDFEDMTGVYKEFEVNEQLALEIGGSVIKKVYGETASSDVYYIVQEVANEGYFIISRCLGRGIVGGDYNVAINKKDGAIIRIWMGE